MTTTKTQQFVVRAITLAEAHWIGNAASVAGGFVATRGPRLSERLDYISYHAPLLLMAVPADAGLADEGLPVSDEMLQRWVAECRSDRDTTYYYLDDVRDALDLYIERLAK